MTKGDKVYYRDCDNDVSTGIYTITYVNVEKGGVIEDDTIIVLDNRIEVFAAEVYIA